MKTITGGFRSWIHHVASLKAKKLKLLRELNVQEGADQSDVDLLHNIQFWVATILVSYSCGNPDAPNVKPYGLKAARSTAAFKKLPSQHLAITFATMYQCVRTEQQNVNNWVKSMRPNISAPWPRGMVRRFVKL